MAPAASRLSVARFQRCMGAAAWLLVIAFACVPALSRVHDRLSLSDQTAGFKPSKNVERPHDRHTPAGLIAVGAAAPAGHSLPAERVTPQGRPNVATGLSIAPRPLRAPPIR